MRRYILIILVLEFSIPAVAQDKTIEMIKASVTRNSAEAHLTFLASDEMRGRGTGSPEIAIAANYLAAQYKIIGLKPVGGTANYFQEVGLQQTLPPKTVSLKTGGSLLSFRSDLLLLRGSSLSQSAEFIFAGYGNDSDLKGIDVRGKIVITYTGSSEKSTAREARIKDLPSKLKLTQSKGAIALIEIVSFTEPSWAVLSSYLSSSSVSLTADDKETPGIPVVWMQKSPVADGLVQQKAGTGTLTIETQPAKIIPGKNVVGIIEGTDPKLKQEYIVLSAHYDHVGVQKNASADSIYNGARDNALGTTAILEAAKFIANHPVRRSILILAFCAEEKGLLGSRWYADHPLVPLNQTVFNLDCDGAGYNDKTIMNLIDLNRTTADEPLKKACLAFGLTLMGDPLPDQNLYIRSDNYNFAAKGVPAVDISPGVKGMDEELMKYYHQPPDEVATLDFDYLEKFYHAYVYAAVLIGNLPERPFWKTGDEFEPVGKKLYGIK
jgi:Peptidase family M28